MADSKENKSGQDKLDKKVDLDTLLDDTDSSNPYEDPFDEETIDRLLMDNAPDEQIDEEIEFKREGNIEEFDENEVSDDEEINEYLMSDSKEVSEDIGQDIGLTAENNRDDEGLPEDFDISNRSDLGGDNQNGFEFSDEDIADELIGDERNNDFAMEDFQNENHYDDEIIEKGDEDIEFSQVSDLKKHINNLLRESEETADDFNSLKNECGEISQRNKFINYLAMGLAVFAVIVAGSMVIINSKLQIQVDEILAAGNESSKLNEVLQSLNDIQLQLADIKNKSQLYPDDQKQINEELKVKIGEIEKNITQINEQIKKSENKTVQKKKKPVKKSAAATPPPKPTKLTTEWYINLVSLNQQWQAKKKAEEFRKKGIPAEISQVLIKGKKWYRILVGGFKTKQEAQSYVPKVKKVLGLDSVWVTN